MNLRCLSLAARGHLPRFGHRKLHILVWREGVTCNAVVDPSEPWEGEAQSLGPISSHPAWNACSPFDGRDVVVP